MDALDHQQRYWDSVAAGKTFTHPLFEGRFTEWVARDAPVLDYGCGYGRTCAELRGMGYAEVTGVDISAAMVARGKAQSPGLDLRHVDGPRLPFADASFGACTLLAVLTCIPTDAGQRQVVAEIARVLRPRGLLFISDYPLQPDERNQARYRDSAAEFGRFGVFRMADGGVVRHHEIAWIDRLLEGWTLRDERNIAVPTMNGHAATVFQRVVEKP